MKSPLTIKSPVALDADQAHYLRHVLRRQPGEMVRLFNEQDGEYSALIQTIDKKAAAVLPVEKMAEPRPVPDLWLLFAPLKKDATDYLVEKAVELGVRELHPVSTAYTQSTRVNIERLNAQARQAAGQCGRHDVPRVLALESLARTLETWPDGRTLIYGDESLSAPLAREVIESLPPQTPAALLIGPEGGFSPDEQALLSKYPFVRGVTLGPRILRAETAAAALLTAFQLLKGDWNCPI